MSVYKTEQFRNAKCMSIMVLIRVAKIAYSLLYFLFLIVIVIRNENFKKMYHLIANRLIRVCC